MVLSLLKTFLLTTCFAFTPLKAQSSNSDLCADSGESKPILNIKKEASSSEGNYQAHIVDIDYFISNMNNLASDFGGYFGYLYEGDFRGGNGVDYKYLIIQYRSIGPSNIIILCNSFTSEGYDDGFRIYRSATSLTNQTFYSRGLITNLTTYDPSPYFVPSSALKTSEFDVIRSIFYSGISLVTLDSNINFNTPLGIGQATDTRLYGGNAPFIFKNQYYTDSTTHQNGEFVTKSISVPNFTIKIRGQPFDTLRFRYKSALGYAFYDMYYDVPQSGEYWTYHAGSSNEIFFWDLSFVDSLSGTSFTVCHNAIDSHNTVGNYCVWVNSTVDFRYLEVFTNNTNSIQNTFGSFGAIQFEPIVIYTSYESSGFYLTQIFNIFRIAWNGLSSFLEIPLLPSLSIGVLLLVPFAVSMLLFVVNLFKR